MSSINRIAGQVARSSSHRLKIIPDVQTELAQATRVLVENSRFRILLPEVASACRFVARCDFKTPSGVVPTKVCVIKTFPQGEIDGKKYMGIMSFVHPEEKIVYSAFFNPGQTVAYACDYVKKVLNGKEIPSFLQNPDIKAVNIDTVNEASTFLANHMKDNPRKYLTEFNPFSQVR